MDKEINYKLLDEMIRCVKREINYRKWVYPKRVQAGNMTQDKADKEIHLMAAVYTALHKIYEGTAPQVVQQTFLDAQQFIQAEANTGYLN